MCKKYVHDKAVEVFKNLQLNVKILRESKRRQEVGYQGPIRFMLRKVYGCINKLSYMIFIVKESDAPFCLATWEVSAEFKELNEELFYFIKSKMLLDQDTKWFCVPISFAPGIDCIYDAEEGIIDFSFLKTIAC